MVNLAYFDLIGHLSHFDIDEHLDHWGFDLKHLCSAITRTSVD